MKNNRLFKLSNTLLIAALLVFNSCEKVFDKLDALEDKGKVKSTTVRFATFNASLNRFNEGDLINDLSTPNNEQAQQVAEVIQRNNPDVLALLEFDYDQSGEALALFQTNYLSISQNGATPVNYEYTYVVSSNTGQLAPVDLDNNGSVSLPGDAFGFGFFPGQFAFVLLSKYPVLVDEIRSFQNFLWKDMPNALLPLNPDSTSFYSDEQLAIFRLSSKNHIDIPVKLPCNEIVHTIIAHPTPPVFDGPEDKNGTRNHDEIRFLSDYVKNKSYIYDDNNASGGLSGGAKFVIMGDLNADPNDGDATNSPIELLSANNRINQQALLATKSPASAGAIEAATVQGGANDSHEGDPAFDTADFGDESPGNLRVDYVLPSYNINITGSGVFWPASGDETNYLNSASDHKLVWMDLKFYNPKYPTKQ